MRKEIKVVRFSIAWILLIMIIIVLSTAFFKNRIFATNKVENENIYFEENNNAIDLIKVMSVNTDSNKKLINEERIVEIKVEYEENPNLPKDEQQIKQEGKQGKIQVTAMQNFENNQLLNEEIIESRTIEEMITQIVYVGTSEFLSKYQVHIGDDMYLLEAEDLKKEANTESETICNIPRYLKVNLKEVVGDWIKVSYNGKEGYVLNSNITSNKVNSLIVEKNRVATLKNNLNIDIDVSIPSGLTLSDFKTVLSNNRSDTNNIFEENAELFYNIEQKYKINGIFLASIGILESGWGTSTIAMDKKNLFGYMAYDRDPYNSAKNFESYAEAIDTVAQALSTKYLHMSGVDISDGLKATGTYYNGPTIQAVNIKYATDSEWGNKVFENMQYLYNRL